MDDTRAWNREAWNHQVASGNVWTLRFGIDVIERARRGDWSVYLTSFDPVPRDWFPADMKGVRILGLAAAGGQQGPVFAAAGADVTVFDNSPAQLAQDEASAREHGLAIRTVEGDMRDLSCFEDEAFDLVFHPVSNVFCEEIRPVWREAFRVLRPGGELLAGFMNPVGFLFDNERWEEKGEAVVRYAIPYADPRDRPPEELERMRARKEPFEFGHSLTDQIGGQLDAGFVLVAMFETKRHESEWKGPVDDLHPPYIATRARKPTPREGADA